MGPLCNTQGKYNYSEETLSGLHKCQFCGKRFKVQGIKKHKASCKNQQELQKEQAQHAIEFKRERQKEYHPCSHQPTLFQKFEEFSIKNKTLHTSPVDSTPWKPFKTQGDHHFTEIALDAGLNKAQRKEQVTITTNAKLQKVCDNMGAELTPVCTDNFLFKVHTKLMWDWALNLLTNPQSAPHFVWDAECVYKHNGVSVCTYSWLPDDIENAIPFCFILYADKTKLLSHGTVKGYPIVVWCTNLPMDIQNSQDVGGGCVVSWLPIVPEDLAEEGKLGYTTLKHVVWHESTLKLFEAMIHFSKASFKHHCWDEIVWYLFSLFLILSANYDEQCMMSLIQGQNGKAPCPAAGNKILKKLGLHPILNVFWLIRYSDPHLALSFDCLHSLHLGLWGKHLFEDLKIILRYFKCGAEATCKLSCFKAILKVSFSDGNKLADLSIQVFYAALNDLTHTACPEGHLLMSLISSYLQLDSLIGLNIHTNCTLSAVKAELLVFNEKLQMYKEAAKKSSIPGLKVDWDFPKTHLWRHVVHDIWEKGILCVNQHILVCKLLCTHIDYYEKWHQSRNREHSNNGNDDNLLPDFEGHFRLGSPCKPTTIQEIEMACDTKDKAYLGFQRKFTQYINKFLPSIWHGLTRWLVIPHHFKMCEYHYLKVNYESWVDWMMATNYIQCNPEFYGAPHYNCAYIQLTSMQTAFVHLVSLFTCQIDNFGKVQLVLIQPYMAGIGQQCRLDWNMKLTCIRAVPRGALVFTDPQKKDKFLVVDHIDSDMFLQVKTWKWGSN
ncbi:hypothetical protein V8B97DRAFT_2024014 [Scleroderma yunnanense]